MIGVISDVRFPRKGIKSANAGHDLAKWIRKDDPSIPILLQSTDENNRIIVNDISAEFLHKNSPTLLNDLRQYIIENFGFGDFIFRNKRGKEISSASDLKSLKKSLNKIPDKTLEYHASKNHFSNWLAVRGEFSIASIIRPLKVNPYFLYIFFCKLRASS